MVNRKKLDPKVRPVITELRKKAYDTRYSCQGHIKEKTAPVITYRNDPALEKALGKTLKKKKAYYPGRKSWMVAKGEPFKNKKERDTFWRETLQNVRKLKSKRK